MFFYNFLIILNESDLITDETDDRDGSDSTEKPVARHSSHSAKSGIFSSFLRKRSQCNKLHQINEEAHGEHFQPKFHIQN